ncbi:unnamed protein product [Withania somnifera]
MRLNDPADVVCVGAVSRLWCQFVSKQLNLRKFPRLSRIARITKPDLRVAKGKDVESSNSSWETLRRDHNVYASLLQAIETSNSCPSDCIANAVRASSTDRFPDESIINTLAPRDRYQDLPPYWSSTGHSDPNAHETLIYKLKADLCVITEINIQPFEVCFHPGKPICSAKSVRFRVGHLKSSSAKSDLLHFPQEQPADDMFIWEYVSEEFPMRQRYLQVELLGIAQICDMDNLFYICIRHVKVRARLLSPAFGVQNVEPSGDFVLKYKRGSLI